MPGPLPAKNAIRRNAPTIPTTSLPVSGRPGPVPDPPDTYDLGPEGRAWWDWAWTTPQAAAWDSGSLYLTARRAQLEDDAHAIEFVDLDLDAFVGEHPGVAAVDGLRLMISCLKGLAGGKLSVVREMRQIDDRLGLTPKGLAQLRWKIVEDEKPDETGKGKPGRGRRGLKVAG